MNEVSSIAADHRLKIITMWALYRWSSTNINGVYCVRLSRLVLAYFYIVVCGSFMMSGTQMMTFKGSINGLMFLYKSGIDGALILMIYEPLKFLKYS